MSPEGKNQPSGVTLSFPARIKQELQTQIYRGKSWSGPQGAVLVLGGFRRPLRRAGRWCARGPWFAVQGAQVRILRALFPARPGRVLWVAPPAARPPRRLLPALSSQMSPRKAHQSPHQLQGWPQTRGCFPKSWIPHGVCSEELSGVSIISSVSSNLGETVATTVGLGVGFVLPRKDPARAPPPSGRGQNLPRESDQPEPRWTRLRPSGFVCWRQTWGRGSWPRVLATAPARSLRARRFAEPRSQRPPPRPGF